jgi:hypothetical protein
MLTSEHVISFFSLELFSKGFLGTLLALPVVLLLTRLLDLFALLLLTLLLQLLEVLLFGPSLDLLFFAISLLALLPSGLLLLLRILCARILTFRLS